MKDTVSPPIQSGTVPLSGAYLPSGPAVSVMPAPGMSPPVAVIVPAFVSFAAGPAAASIIGHVMTLQGPTGSRVQPFASPAPGVACAKAAMKLDSPFAE